MKESHGKKNINMDKHIETGGQRQDHHDMDMDMDMDMDTMTWTHRQCEAARDKSGSLKSHMHMFE